MPAASVTHRPAARAIIRTAGTEPRGLNVHACQPGQRSFCAGVAGISRVSPSCTGASVLRPKIHTSADAIDIAAMIVMPTAVNIMSMAIPSRVAVFVRPEFHCTPQLRQRRHSQPTKRCRSSAFHYVRWHSSRSLDAHAELSAVGDVSLRHHGDRRGTGMLFGFPLRKPRLASGELPARPRSAVSGALVAAHANSRRDVVERYTVVHDCVEDHCRCEFNRHDHLRPGEAKVACESYQGHGATVRPGAASAQQGVAGFAG